MSKEIEENETNINSAFSEGSQGSTGTDGAKSVHVPQKWKTYKKRSVVWEHFIEFTDDKGGLRSRCKHCGKDYGSNSKSSGTSNMRNHIGTCAMNPNNKPSTQSQLAYNTCLDEINGEEKVSLVAWKFDQKNGRMALAEMIIIDELPLRIVEHEGFKRFIRKIQPAFVIPSRRTLTRDCYQLYFEAKSNLRSQLKKIAPRMCLTTDTWTSVQRINYMCLTGHFIDNDWNLRKVVLNFCPVDSHKGQDIGKSVEKCLVDWGLHTICTVTVDNASSNDVALDYLKKKCVNWGGSYILQGKWMHVRCVAHIINLIVQDGVKELGSSVESVRAAVKYVRQSPARLRKFYGYAKLENCESSKSLCLDVATRWNSTYLMLSVALEYERAFRYLEQEDDNFVKEVVVPQLWDWDNVRRLVVFLEHFYVLTVRISGTKYITTDSYLDDISSIYALLKDSLNSPDAELREMASSMLKKFEKYWGNVEKFNMLVFIASAFDPRNKLDYCEIVLCQMYGDDEGARIAEIVKGAMYEVFNDYRRIYSVGGAGNSAAASLASSTSSCSSYSSSRDNIDPLKKIRDQNRAALKKKKTESGFVRDLKSELDRYLTEECDDDTSTFEAPDFCVLKWWKRNTPQYPILSNFARDILAIPISTVASESVFSTGGRVLDAFRSSLTPRLVQALICAQDWYRGAGIEIKVEENIEELENFEEEIQQTMMESTVVDV